MTTLVIDIGSSSARTLLFDEQLHPLPDATATAAYQFTTTPPGAAVIDAIQLCEAVETCIDQTLQYPAAQSIQVVGMATFVGNLLGLDDDGGPVTPVYTYADTRSALDLETLRAQVDIAQTQQRTGCPHHTAYHPARLHWLQRTQPDTFKRVARWVDLGTYLYRCWFGDAPASYSVTSWSGMLHREKLAWDQDWIDRLDIDPATLPPLADVDHMLRGLIGDYAARWPLLRDVPFCLAVGDGAAANIGSGAVDPAHMALTVGTTAALRVVTQGDVPTVPDGLWSYRVDHDHHLTGGATSEGGSIFAWARDTLQLPTADLEAELAQRQADAHGLTFLPLLAGERSPGWWADATGTITGLRLSTTPLDMLQAALEAVALRLSFIADQLAASDVRVMAGGGALAASPAWTQIIANALDAPLHLLAEPEITARGVAILAQRALGRNELDTYMPEIDRIIAPQPEAVGRLRAARDRQSDLYRRMRAGTHLPHE